MSFDLRKAYAASKTQQPRRSAAVAPPISSPGGSSTTGSLSPQRSVVRARRRATAALGSLPRVEPRASFVLGEPPASIGSPSNLRVAKARRRKEDAVTELKNTEKRLCALLPPLTQCLGQQKGRALFKQIATHPERFVDDEGAVVRDVADAALAMSEAGVVLARSERLLNDCDIDVADLKHMLEERMDAMERRFSETMAAMQRTFDSRLRQVETRVEVIDAHFNAALRHHEELLSLDDESAAAPSSPVAATDGELLDPRTKTPPM